MASTPSASALSAVLRCQRNILARKQANQTRTPASVYGFGMTYGESVKSYIRSLWGFIFHRDRVAIPGVLSVTARFETSCLGKSKIRESESKDHLLKNSSKTENKMLTVKIPAANRWSKKKQMSDCNSAFTKSQSFCILSQNNLVLRLDGKVNPTWTCCICVVCAQNKNNANSLFSPGLLWFLKHKLICFTTAVSDSLRTLPGIDWNQLHPDCDKMSGCVKCTSEYHEDQPKTPEGTELEE